MPRVAFVHDWLTGLRGGEKCLERLIRLFPDCEIFTLFHRKGSTSPTIESRPIQPSWLQHLPGWRRYYRYLLPLFPRAARWKIEDCDLVVSLSHCVAKSAIAPVGVPHVCYCFTPMRYAWHMKDQYFGTSRSLKDRVRDRLLSSLREWDRTTSNRVDHFVAISKTIAKRIHESYDRDSEVIFPPVDTDFYRPAPVTREDYYLVVSALAPYKRIDLAIEACQRVNRNLVIIGTGQDEQKLKAKAGGNVTWLGWQPDSVIRHHMQTCRALIFPGEEDFGIVPVEAQACGAAVIAFGRGGATETIAGLGNSANPTGLFFSEQSSESLAEALLRFEARRGEFDPNAARLTAMDFSADRFDEKISNYLAAVLARRTFRHSRAA
ncbi:MAG: glycosyltransferase [Gemmataceae bacterium]